MRIRLCLTILSLASTIGRCPFARCEVNARQTKGEALAYLQNMRELNVKRLREVDGLLRNKMGDETSAEDDINRLRADRREHMLRQDFIGRLIFQVDTRYAGGDLRLFLQGTLRELAKTEVTADNRDDQGLWKFMKYAAEVLGGASEKREDALAFLDGYMQRSVSNPVNPRAYLASRNYSNGLHAEAGHPLGADIAGAIAAARTTDPKAAVAIRPAPLHPKR